MLRFSVLLLCLTGLTLAEDKKPPVGPVAAGMTYKGVFRTGTPNKRGVLKDPFVASFKLKFESIEGEAFEGIWSWDTKEVTKVKGRITRSGVITLRFTENIKGRSPAAFDGKAAGKVSKTKLQLRYVRPSGKRIGLAEAEIVEKKNQKSDNDETDKKGEKDRKDKKDKT